MQIINPHDFVWVGSNNDVPVESLPEWVRSQWNHKLPLTVYRDKAEDNKLTVSIRGIKPHQRVTTQINKSA
ncbi:malonate decarboxylase holo-ACP synthase, partial [Bacillus subtilis]